LSLLSIFIPLVFGGGFGRACVSFAGKREERSQPHDLSNPILHHHGKYTECHAFTLESMGVTWSHRFRGRAGPSPKEGFIHR
jgi:hypothetical protein